MPRHYGSSLQGMRRPPGWPRGPIHLHAFNSAADLRNMRKLLGLTQAQLAELSKFSRQAVYYHEGKKGRVDGHAPRAFRDVFEANGYHVPRYGEPAVTIPAKPPKYLCLARTAEGPCRRHAGASGRCELHGGLSTGPKTPEGRARIAEAQRKRHAAHRLQVEAGA